MTGAQDFNDVFRYKTAMAVFKSWFSSGAISKSDLFELNAALCEKYGLSQNSIFLENDLLCAEIRANMRIEENQEDSL